MEDIRKETNTVKTLQAKLKAYEDAVIVVPDDEEAKDGDIVIYRDYGEASRKYGIYLKAEPMESVIILCRNGKPVIKQSELTTKE